MIIKNLPAKNNNFPACQLCGQDAFKSLFRVEKANFSSNIRAFDIMRCNNCGLSTMKPFPTNADIEELYVKTGVFSNVQPNPYQRSISFRILEPLYQKFGNDLYFIARNCIRLTKGGGSVLDIGCGVGRLLEWFHRLQPYTGIESLTGIDIDPKARINAISSIQSRIIIDNFPNHDFNGKFDIITMRFVIEHLLDFKGYLARARDLLKPGGILFFSTPDIESKQAVQLKENWNLIYDPNQRIGHLRWFNQQSVHFLAKQLEMKIEKYSNRGQFIYRFPVATQNLLRKFLGVEPGTGRFIRFYTPRIIYATLFDGLFSEWASFGDGLYVFLRKI